MRCCFCEAVYAERRAEIEVLERVQVDVCIAEHAPVCVAVVGIALQARYRIFAVGIAADGAGKFTFGSIYR